jgi:anhydro-N-acetylmuramic acid kinase
MNAAATSTAELARLNWRLGLAYAEAVSATVERHKAKLDQGKLDLIGCHGQTLYHQPRAARYAGRRFGCTWQLGEAAVIAAATGVPVVSNFRPADMVAGGQGAPLVSLLDYVLFADGKRGRVLQNIGGIANLTAIPAGAAADAVVAFDTGPGNMVIDWLAQELFQAKFDRNGNLAARGSVLGPVLAKALGNPYFKLKPPRTAGREQFGREYAAKFLAACQRLSCKPEDALATATALTAETIAQGYKLFARRGLRGGLHRLWRRGAQPDADGDAGAKAGAAGLRTGYERRLRFARRSQGGRGLCSAGLADLAPPAGKSAQSHRRGAADDPGAGDLCVGA